LKAITSFIIFQSIHLKFRIYQVKSYHACINIGIQNTALITPNLGKLRDATCPISLKATHGRGTSTSLHLILPWQSPLFI